LSVTLKWYELPKKKSSYIYLSTNEFDPANRDQWPRQHAWMHHWLEAFYDCFRPRIEALKVGTAHPTVFAHDADRQRVQTTQPDGTIIYTPYPTTN